MQPIFNISAGYPVRAMRPKAAKTPRCLACILAASLVIPTHFSTGAQATTASPVPSYVCPTSVPVAITEDGRLPAVWTGYVDSDLYLHAATITGGPPELHADLTTYTTRPGKTQWSYTYDLDDEFLQGKWLQCGYGVHSEVTLSQRIPDFIKSCSFTYKEGSKAGQNIIRIECK